MLWIDDHQIETDGAATILEAALSAGIHIPTLCHHPALEPFGSCRLCTVEIEKEGKKRFVTACNYPVEEGLVVRTATPAVLNLRRMVVELLFARCSKENRSRSWQENTGSVNLDSCQRLRDAFSAACAVGSVQSWWVYSPSTFRTGH